MKILKLERNFLVFAAFMLLFSANQALCAQSEFPGGLALSDFLYDFLTDSGLEVRRQDLSTAEPYNYPQNLTVTLSAQNADTENKNWLDSSVNRIIFSFTQNFAAGNPDFLLEFIRRLKEAELSYEAVILLTANDSDLSFLNDSSRHPTGSESYVEDSGYDGRTCAIIIDPADGKRSVTIGEGKDVAPLYLVRTMSDAFEKKGLDPSVNAAGTLSQKMGLTGSNGRLSPFMQANIPAAAFSLFAQEDDLDILEYTASTLSVLNKSNWDRHYFFFRVGQESYWPGEAVFILGFIIASVIILLGLSFTTFTGTYRSRAMARDILRSLFMIPMTIILSAAVLHLSQLILEASGVKNPLSFLTAKILITLLVLNALYIIQIRLDFFVSIKASGYLMLLVAAMNFFIYSCMEITLLFFFFLEYLLYYIADRSRKTAALIITFILTVIPAAVLITGILRSAQTEALTEALHFSIFRDFIFALTLFPLLMQMNRILISMDLFSAEKKLSAKKLSLYSAAVLASILITVLAFFTVIASLTPEKPQMNEPEKMTVTESLEEGILNVSRKTSPFMELTLNEISIESREQLIRLSVAVISAEETAIYNSNYEYVPFDSRTGSFTFADYPDGPVSLSYSTEQDAVYSLDISAYTTDGNFSVKHLKLSLNCLPEAED